MDPISHGLTSKGTLHPPSSSARNPDAAGTTGGQEAGRAADPPASAEHCEPSPHLVPMRSHTKEEVGFNEEDIQEKMREMKVLFDDNKTKGHTRRKHYWLFSEQEELAVLMEKYGPGSWRINTLKFITSHTVQSIIVALLIIDVLIIFTELFLDAQFPPCYITERDAISCCPATGTATDFNALADLDIPNDFLASLNYPSPEFLFHQRHAVPGVFAVTCSNPDTSPFEAYPPTCDPHLRPGVHTAHIVLFSFSISILTLFELELIVLIIVLGPIFFRNPLYILDLVVVTASIALEICLFYITANAIINEVLAVLIVCRLWRLVRIAHGLVSSMHVTYEGKLHKAEEAYEELQESLGSIIKYVNYLEDRLAADAPTVGAKAENIQTAHDSVQWD